MDYVQIIRTAATTLNLLDEKGALIPLDSLAVLDLVNELEQAASVSVPTNEIQAETFSSIDSIAAMLARLKQAS